MKRSRVGLHRFRILLGGRFIYVDVTQLADSIKSRLPGGESDIPRLVGVGTSGSELCERIVDSDNVPRIEVATAKYARERQERRLTIGEIPDINNPILVDDIAVSGLTLGAVSRRVEKTKQTPAAVVGMCMKSKRLNRMVGLGERFMPLITYALEGGGSPPINSTRSLLAYPERLAALTKKYFPNDGTEFKQLIKEIES
jgi:hypoxanthine-guanine phosphoribosyltransferase